MASFMFFELALFLVMRVRRHGRIVRGKQNMSGDPKGRGSNKRQSVLSSTSN